MAKATVLKCDQCDAWDSESTHVRTVSIAGPKLELCTSCRAKVLVFVGIKLDLAMRYQQMVDTREDKAGTWPALSSAENWVPPNPDQLTLDAPDSESGASREERGEESAGDAAEQPGDSSGVSGDSGEAAPDTPPKRSPSRRRAPKE